MGQQEHDQFTELFISNQARVYRYLVSLVPNRADADDLFQRTSITLWKLWDRYDQTRDFIPWAFQIAQNEVRNFLRASHNRPLSLSDEMLAELGQTRAEEDTYLAKRQDALTHCIEKLSSPQKELLERCYGEHGTMKEIAINSGKSPEAIYKAIQRIRDVLFACVNQSQIPGMEQ